MDESNFLSQTLGCGFLQNVSQKPSPFTQMGGFHENYTGTWTNIVQHKLGKCRLIANTVCTYQPSSVPSHIVLLLGSNTTLSLPAGDGGHVTSDILRAGVVCPGGVTSNTLPGEVCPLGGVLSDTRLLHESLFARVSSEVLREGEGERDDSISTENRKW